MATPLEVYQGLAADGYQVSYRRVPLSRERTPEAADLDVLHQQLMTQPVGQFFDASHVLALPVPSLLLASGFALQQLVTQPAGQFLYLTGPCSASAFTAACLCVCLTAAHSTVG